VIAAHALSARRREFLSALMETLLLRKALKEKDRKIKYAFLPSIYMDAMKNVPVASIFCLERARASTSSKLIEAPKSVFSGNQQRP